MELTPKSFDLRQLLCGIRCRLSAGGHGSTFWLCQVTASYFGTCREISIAPRNTLEERIQVGAVKCEQRC
jgi:hypothetical protein